VTSTNYQYQETHQASQSLNHVTKQVNMGLDEFTDASNNDDSQGVALKAAKDKWNELGPLRLDDIIANSKIQID
jgi:hypothetical protein